MRPPGWGEVQGTVFHVMPFVEGDTLRDRLDREQQLPIDDAVRLTREIALDYAHRKGVIHATSRPRSSCSTRGRRWWPTSASRSPRRPRLRTGWRLRRLVSVTSLAKGDVVNSSIVGLPLGYAAGQLLYMAIGDDALFSVAFDPTAARAMQAGSVVSVGASNAALSATGVLVSASGGRAARVLWVSADGRAVTPIPGLDSVIRAGDPRLSPDGSQLAFTRDDGNRNASIAM